MASPTIQIVPPEVETAARAFIAQLLPGREIARIRVAASSPSECILRVFFASKMMPSPYRVYRVEIPSMAVRHLQGQDADAYRIPHYK